MRASRAYIIIDIRPDGSRWYYVDVDDVQKPYECWTQKLTDASIYCKSDAERFQKCTPNVTINSFAAELLEEFQRRLEESEHGK